MRKKFCEKNLTFSSTSPAEKALNEGAVIKTIEKNIEPVRVNEKILISDEEQQKNKKSKMILDKVNLILNIVTSIAFLFFITEVIKGFDFVDGIHYNFNVVNTIGIIVFIISQVTGVFLFVAFFTKQNLKIKMVMVTAPLLIILLGGAWLLMSLNTFEGEQEIALVNTLGLADFDTSSIDFKYVIIAVAVFLAVLYFLYGWLFKKYKNQAKQIVMENKATNQEPLNK